MLVPSDHGSFMVGGQAFVLGEDNGTVKAWAERFVRKDPDVRWLLGNYVEANKPNLNGHSFPLADLAPNVNTVTSKALNMLHREQHCVGAYAAAQLLLPDGTEVTTAAAVADIPTDVDPYVESLAAFWHRRFPDEFFDVKAAHAEGTLYYSMEAVPAEVSCPTCEDRKVFAGLESDTYCEHMNHVTGPKRLHDPVFVGGAVIIPPARPGWSHADMKTISQVISRDEAQAEAIYEGFKADLAHLTPAQWEAMMGQFLLEQAKA